MSDPTGPEEEADGQNEDDVRPDSSPPAPPEPPSLPEGEPGRSWPTPAENEPQPGSSPAELDVIEFFSRRGFSLPDFWVTVARGRIGRAFGPADLLSRLTERISALVEDIGGSEAMLYGMLPGNSMTMYFGDSPPQGAQGELPIGATHDAASRVGDLIETSDDEFFARALRIGTPMKRYDDLAQLIENEGLTLSWQPRGREARKLTPEAAGDQHRRLQASVETEEWETIVHGVLYRVIADPGSPSGTAGIHLFNWSEPPPGLNRKAIAPASRQLLDAALEAGLFGESVQARVRLRRAKLHQSINPNIEKEWIEIKAGPDESSAFGVSLEELIDEEEKD